MIAFVSSLFIVYTLGLFQRDSSSWWAERHAFYAIRRQELDGVAFMYEHDEETDM
jgi:hypothetical protein